MSDYPGGKNMKRLPVLVLVIFSFLFIAANDESSTMQRKQITKSQMQIQKQQGAPVITSPVASTPLCLGTNVPITWTGFPGGGNVKIELFHTNNVLFKTITAAAPNTGTYQWNLDPKVYVFGHGIFIMKITSDSGQSAESERINVGKELSVYAPKSNHTWRTGSEYSIQWTVGCVIQSSAVKIDLLDASMNPVLAIVSDTPINRIYKWKVPADLKTGAYSIRITTADNLHSATGSFKIDSPVPAPVNNPDLVITSPAKDAVWFIGDTAPITWNAPKLGSAKLKIELLYTNNEPWKVIEAAAPNTGSFQFFIDPSKYVFGSGVFRLRIGKADGSVYSEIQPVTIKKK